MSDSDVPEPVNDVVLRGRLSADPEHREMPSGDKVVTWRLVVQRPPGQRTSRVTVDTLDCTAWSSTSRRSASRLRADDQVEVHGSVRRHFRRGAAGSTSWFDIEVVTVRRLSRRSAPAA